MTGLVSDLRYLFFNKLYFSIVLIAISSGSTVEVLNKLLESVFNAVVLIVGIDEMKSQRNIERLKRELRVGVLKSKA